MNCTIFRHIFKYNRNVLYLNSCKNISSKQKNPQNDNLIYLCNHLKITETKAQHICWKYPYVKKLDEVRIRITNKTIQDLGFNQDTLVSEPSLFSLLPITIKYRYKVLEECGVKNISSEHLISYLSLMKQNTIGKLKMTGVLLDKINLENRLASYMTQWPTSLTSDIVTDINELTLYSLRLQIIQRYLELILDLTTIEFYRGIKTYPTLKHRPLKSINETLHILQSEIMMTSQKLKSNFYLVHADPENLQHIIYKVKTIGGIDVKEIIRMQPRIALKNYTTILEIKEILKDYGISDEAQTKCFEIFTLGPQTVKERLEKAKTIPEFNTFFNHPRFLKMIHYNTTAMKRLSNLYNSKKKCASLNILSGSSVRFEMFEKSPGDRLGKGKDLIFCIQQSLGKKYSAASIRNTIKRHPFWINIPLVQVEYVYKKLSNEFSSQDIFENCPVLLYPWNKIREILKEMKAKPIQSPLQNHPEQLVLSKLSKSQMLSLVLYNLEKRHYFSGNGVWSDDRSKYQHDLFTTRNIKAELTSQIQ